MRVRNIDRTGTPERKYYNPLFDGLTSEFDQLIKEFNVTDDYILDYLYCDVSETKNKLNNKLIKILLSKDNHAIKCGEGERPQQSGYVYIIYGRKGLGKTTFAKYFIKKYLQNNESVYPIYLNLIGKKNDIEFGKYTHKMLLMEIYKCIQRSHNGLEQYIYHFEYAKQIDDYTDYDKASLFMHIRNHRDEFIENLLLHLKRLNAKVYLFIDNIDDHPISVINKIVSKCTELQNEFAVKCIITLRKYHEELTIDDRTTCAKEIEKPCITTLINKRLDRINADLYSGECFICFSGKTKKVTSNNIIDIYKKFHNVVVNKNVALHRKIFALSNFSIRDYLDNIYNFFHSPYLFSRPVFYEMALGVFEDIDNSSMVSPKRSLKLFDYLQNLMAIHYLYYDTARSKIFNFFHCNYKFKQNNYQNTLIYNRMLNLLPLDKRAVRIELIHDKLSCIGYGIDLVYKALNDLLHHGLIFSRQGIESKRISSCRLTEKGKIYLSEIIYEFTYLHFICDDVPMPSTYHVDISNKFGNSYLPIDRSNLKYKFESVDKFIRFIANEESDEFNACPPDCKSELSQARGGVLLSSEMDRRFVIVKDRILSSHSEFPVTDFPEIIIQKKIYKI